MRKEEERKTKQKRRVVNAAPEQENEITQKKSVWCSGAGQGRRGPCGHKGRAAYGGTGRAAGTRGALASPAGQRGVRTAGLRRRHHRHTTGSAALAGSAHHADSTCHPVCCQLAVPTPPLCPPLCPLAVSSSGQPMYSVERHGGTIHTGQTER